MRQNVNKWQKLKEEKRTREHYDVDRTILFARLLKPVLVHQAFELFDTTRVRFLKLLDLSIRELEAHFVDTSNDEKTLQIVIDNLDFLNKERAKLVKDIEAELGS